MIKQLEKLTEKEKQVYYLMKSAPTLKWIAAHMGLSYKTIQHHAQRIYDKLSVRNRCELIIFMLKCAEQENMYV